MSGLERLARLAPAWPLAGDARDAARALRAFYAVLLALAASSVYEMRGSARVVMAAGEQTLWPAFWLRWVPAERASTLVGALFVAAALAGALWPHRRWARALACLGLWEFVAVMVSLANGFFPAYHQWCAAAFVLALLPEGWEDPAAPAGRRERALLTLWAAQAVFLLSYSMAGLSKLSTAAWQTWLGEPSVFTAEGARSLLRFYMAETTRLGPLGRPLLESSGVYGVLHAAGALLQVGAVGLAYSPRLHRPAGALVVAFHLATFLVMGIFFKPSVLLAAVLLFASPFAAGPLSASRR